MCMYLSYSLVLFMQQLSISPSFFVVVGCTISQTDTSNLKYLYEGHPEFSAIPSYAVIPAQVIINKKGTANIVSSVTVPSPLFLGSNEWDPIRGYTRHQGVQLGSGKNEGHLLSYLHTIA